jgi:hypothetical protein
MNEKKLEAAAHFLAFPGGSLGTRKREMNEKKLEAEPLAGIPRREPGNEKRGDEHMLLLMKVSLRKYSLTVIAVLLV